MRKKSFSLYRVTAAAYLLFSIGYLIVRPFINSCVAGGRNIYPCLGSLPLLDVLFTSPLVFVLSAFFICYSLIRLSKIMRAKGAWYASPDTVIIILALLTVAAVFYGMEIGAWLGIHRFPPVTVNGRTYD